MEQMFIMQLFKYKLQNAPSSTRRPALPATRISCKETQRRSSPPRPARLLALRQHLMEELQHHLSVRIPPVPSSSPSADTSGLRGAWGECCESALHLEQQQSAAQRRMRIGRVSSTNMMQLAAPCEVLPIPCRIDGKYRYIYL